MGQKLGAIILTIYYVLDEIGKTNDWFDELDIFDNLTRFKSDSIKSSIIAKIHREHKKHSRNKKFVTLSSASRIKGWLNKHTYRKPRFWFKKENDKFKIKQMYLEELSDALQNIKQ